MDNSKETIIVELGKIAIYLDKHKLAGWANITRGAVNILHGEKARILTRQDANKWEGYVYTEVKDSNILGLKLISFRTVYEQYDEPITIDKLSWDLYGKTWRLWSAMPTKADRKGAKWDA